MIGHPWNKLFSILHALWKPSLRLHRTERGKHTIRQNNRSSLAKRNTPTNTTNDTNTHVNIHNSTTTNNDNDNSNNTNNSNRNRLIYIILQMIGHPTGFL